MPVCPAESHGRAAWGNLHLPMWGRGACAVPGATPSPQVLVAKANPQQAAVSWP